MYDCSSKDGAGLVSVWVILCSCGGVVSLVAVLAYLSSLQNAEPC